MKNILGKITIIVLLLSTTIMIYPLNATQGPRTEDLVIRYYSGVEAAYAALKACEIDIVGFPITSDLFQDAITDPNICLGAVAGLDMYEFDINNNCTIQTYPGIESPTHGIKRKDFRKALTYLTDKNFYVNTICGGFADRIDQPIAYMHRGWRNTSCWWEDGTSYNYNSLAAEVTLDAAGFTQGTTPNPDYDAMYPGSAEFMRVYPPDHPTHAGQDLHPLIFCQRTDDLRLLAMGRALETNMKKLGIPVASIAGTKQTLYPIVMGTRDYHIYTGGWSLSRFPAEYLYYLYHCSFWYPNGPNYVTGCACSWDCPIPPGHQPPPDPDYPGEDSGWCEENCCNYPKLDYYLYKAKHAESYGDAIYYVKKALGYGWCEQFTTIPLFSSRSYWAWKCNIKGVVCAEGVGLENKFNWMNCYNTQGDTIVYGLKNSPIAMNIIYSSWYYDYQCLNKMNLFNEIDNPPYDLARDQVGFISDWTVSSWIDPDDAEEKTLITECYRTDGYFAKPVTGDQGENVNNTHKYASIWYNYQIHDSWHNPSVRGIKTLRMIDCSDVKDGQTGVEIYWDTKSYWHLYQGVVPFLSFDWYDLPILNRRVSETLTSDVNGYLGTTEPVFWIISASHGVTPLTVGVDLDIYKSQTGPHAADVRIINPAFAGLPIDITYLAIDDATGYTPGNIPWDMSFEGAGMYYAVDFQAGSGGHLILKKNPFYPMESVPLGEVDFVKKSNGCHKIDIFDVVIAASAYGTQGGGVPDPRWFPGADLAPECCVVDIYDIVTITSKYGQTFDCDP